MIAAPVMTHCGEFRPDSVDRDIEQILVQKQSNVKNAQESLWMNKSELSNMEFTFNETVKEFQGNFH
jgi:hypothetical protein